MANKIHVELLLSSLNPENILSESWNNWRNIDSEAIPDLSNWDFSNSSFWNLDLHDSNLSNCNFQDTHFTGCDLSGCDLSNATLKKVSFFNCNLDNVILNEANCEEMFLNQTPCREVIAVNTNFQDLRGSYSDWRNSTLNSSNFSNAYLFNADLSECGLESTILHKADLTNAMLYQAQLNDAVLSDTMLVNADMMGANFSNANLENAVLFLARANNSQFSGANLKNANIAVVDFTEANLENAIITGCSVYGVSIWNTRLSGAKQENLVITRPEEPELTVDNIEVAQFMYLILQHKKLRDVLETVTSKSVLILGRFSDTKLKSTLDRIRNRLREHNYLPIVFDFERVSGLDYIETIRVIAGVCKFVIADLTSPRSVQQELEATINIFEIPFIPIISSNEQPWGTYEAINRKDHVLELVSYSSADDLLSKFNSIILDRAEKKHAEIMFRKMNKTPNIKSSQDFPRDDDIN